MTQDLIDQLRAVDEESMYQFPASTYAIVNAAAGTIEAQARRIEALEKALKPFSSVGELLDLETEGFSDEDDLGLITEEGHLMDRFSVGEFRAARAALHIRDGE